MSPEEETHEEALRRIGEAGETGALELDLSGLGTAPQACGPRPYLLALSPS
jgi:hypothetical protein